MIRPATEADLPQIGEMFADHLVSLGYAPDPELDRDMSELPRSYDRFLVVEEDGRLISMGGVRSGEVRRIYVRPEHRSRGIARRLIGMLVSEEKSARAVVAKQNDPARRAFLASGFTPSGRSPDHPKMQHCEILEKKTC